MAMGWGWFENKHHETADWTGFLEQGVKLEGILETTGLFRIDSHMKGTLISRETLIVGEHAVVEGEILGDQVVLSGRFDGTIHATGRVEIHLKAIVAGEIHSPCLILEPGAVFDGQFHMVTTPATEGAKPVVIRVRSAVGQP
jgi:cytoskeletal protein CcmA (bactofilin family)